MLTISLCIALLVWLAAKGTEKTAHCTGFRSKVKIRIFKRGQPPHNPSRLRSPGCSLPDIPAPLAPLPPRVLLESDYVLGKRDIAANINFFTNVPVTPQRPSCLKTT